MRMNCLRATAFAFVVSSCLGLPDGRDYERSRGPGRSWHLYDLECRDFVILGMSEQTEDRWTVFSPPFEGLEVRLGDVVCSERYEIVGAIRERCLVIRLGTEYEEVCSHPAAIGSPVGDYPLQHVGTDRR